MRISESYSNLGLDAAYKDMAAAKNETPFMYGAVLAGMYIGFGVLLSFTVGGMFLDASFAKLIMGCTFGIALSLVMICGAELFTGNNMTLMAGRLERRISTKDMIILWLACWCGNWIGSAFLSFVYCGTGLYAGATAMSISSSAIAKVSAGAIELFMRGVLCNILVCLAVWSGYRTKSDAAKLIMVFWCLLAFFTTGFEHSIANMTLLNVAFLNGAITFWQMMYNLVIVTAGNVVGGVLLAIMYKLMSIDAERRSGCDERE